MPNKTFSYRVNPLPQAEHLENLYRRSLTQTRHPERPSKPTAPLLNRSTESPSPPPRLESDRPRQSPAIGQQQLVEAQAIAQRVQDTSGSSQLEFLLRRQESKRYEHWQQQKPLMELEYLAIARRSDGCYQIANQGTRQPFSRHVFKTVQYCAEAAVEIEQRFELGGMLEFLDAEVQEHVEAIVLAVVWRERVEIELAGT